MKFLNEEEEPVIRSATTYVIEGEVSNEEFEAIKHHCINPVDSREIGMENRKRWLQNLKSLQMWRSWTDFRICRRQN